MIPAMNASSVLPPFIGSDPGNAVSMSPYAAGILEFVARFATSFERVVILRGLISYRKALRSIGVIDGWQWLDGSFVEDVETIRRRSPADIDLVTFSRVPGDAAEKRRVFMANPDLFNRDRTKELFKCDAFFVELDKRPEWLVDDTRFWFGLFSHQRKTALWKGMVKLSMHTKTEDDAAVALLDQVERDLGGGHHAEEA
jgi:hypothetical protein